MEITDIKQRLSLEQVLQSYNLQPNKNNMLRCPFHEDKTASLQVNPTQNKYKCHACDKKGDVIQFVQDYEKLTKREAIIKCKELANKQPQVIIHQPITMNQASNNFEPSPAGASIYLVER